MWRSVNLRWCLWLNETMSLFLIAFSIILAALGGVFINLDLVLILAIATVFLYRENEKGVFLAVSYGLINDLFQARWLGVSSLIYLSLLLLINLYQRKLRLLSPGYLFFFVLLGLLLTNWFWTRQWRFWLSFFGAGLSIPLYILLEWIGYKLKIKNKK